MRLFDIKTKLEEKIKEIGGTITGTGSMVVPPYTMDISFELDSTHYAIILNEKPSFNPS